MGFPRRSHDDTYRKIFQIIMDEIFNAPTADDFVLYDKKKKRMFVGAYQDPVTHEIMGGRELTPQQANEIIQAAVELRDNILFQMILAQISYNGLQRMARAADFDADIFAKGLLYASDLAKRVVAEVSGLTVITNESSHEGKTRPQRRN